MLRFIIAIVRECSRAWVRLRRGERMANIWNWRWKALLKRDWLKRERRRSFWERSWRKRVNKIKWNEGGDVEKRGWRRKKCKIDRVCRWVERKWSRSPLLVVRSASFALGQTKETRSLFASSPLFTYTRRSIVFSFSCTPASPLVLLDFLASSLFHEIRRGNERRSVWATTCMSRLGSGLHLYPLSYHPHALWCTIPLEKGVWAHGADAPIRAYNLPCYFWLRFLIPQTYPHSLNRFTLFTFPLSSLCLYFFQNHPFLPFAMSSSSFSSYSIPRRWILIKACV